jgi:hypothetical protein
MASALAGAGDKRKRAEPAPAARDRPADDIDVVLTKVRELVLNMRADGVCITLFEGYDFEGLTSRHAFVRVIVQLQLQSGNLKRWQIWGFLESEKSASDLLLK